MDIQREECQLKTIASGHVPQPNDRLSPEGATLEMRVVPLSEKIKEAISRAFERAKRDSALSKVAD